MNFTIISYFLWIFMIQKLQAEEKKVCLYGTEIRLLFADCSKLYLETFPKDLKKNIEGIYLSWNFIEYLPNDAFENYSSIQFLYFDHNALHVVESYVFAPLSKLSVLDLSKNNHLNISNLYFPKSLKKMYLDGITIKTTLPISSLKELNYLSLSKCNLDNIPSFGGSLPSLEVLNLTENKLKNFKVDNIAFLCRLKKLHMSDNTAFQNNCECLRLKFWMNSKNITGSHITCRSSENDENCDLTPSALFLKNHESCEKDVTIKKIHSWFIIGCICFAGFATIFSCILLYFCCNRKGFFHYTIRCYCCRKKSARECSVTFTS